MADGQLHLGSTTAPLYSGAEAVTKVIFILSILKLRFIILAFLFQDPRDALLRHRAERGLDGGDAAGLPAGGTSSAHWQSGEQNCSRNSKYLVTHRRLVLLGCGQEQVGGPATEPAQQTARIHSAP